jgi:hypothetical protein
MGDSVKYTKKHVDAILQDGEIPEKIDKALIAKMEKVLLKGYKVTPNVARNFIMFCEEHWPAFWPILNTCMKQGGDKVFIKPLRRTLMSMRSRYQVQWRDRYERLVDRQIMLHDYLEERKSLRFLSEK